jgi:antitoxin HicB
VTERRRYTILLIPEPEAGGYSVQVPALPGCFTQGETYQEALENAREAIQCHTEGLRLDGEPVPTEDAAPELAAVEV